MATVRQTAAPLPIRAAVTRRGRVAIEPVELDAPRADEVLVRVVASGICHTDLDFLDEQGVVLGHEGAGVVERVGRRVDGFRPGDHVVMSFQSCGRCGECRAGHPAGCVRLGELNFGFARRDGSSAYRRSGVRGHFFGQSSFATHALATRRNLVKVPRTLPLEILAPLGCGLQTGAGTVIHSLAARAGHRLAVFGTGSVGLAAVMAARIVRAAPIVAVDVRPARLALARELGATHAIDARKGDVARRLAHIAGAFDGIVDTTGDAALGGLGRALLAPNGRLILLAGGADEALPGGREVRFVAQGDSVPQRFIPKLIRLWRGGAFPFDRLLRRYAFDDVARAIADLRTGRAVKPVLCMVVPAERPRRG